MLNVDLQPEWQSPTGELQASIEHLNNWQPLLDDELPFLVIVPNKELENETL